MALKLALLGSLITAVVHADPKPPIATTPPTLDAAVTTALAKGGWRDAQLLYATPKLTVLDAKQRGKRRLVIINAKRKVIDAGERPEGTLTIEAHGLPRSAPTAISITASSDVGQGGWSTQAWIWVVRDSGERACIIEGSSGRGLGKACGSSGWSTVEVTAGTAPNTLEATVEHTGVWSVSDGMGGCLPRSPTRSGPQRTVYTLRASGPCKVGKPGAATRSSGPRPAPAIRSAD